MPRVIPIRIGLLQTLLLSFQCWCSNTGPISTGTWLIIDSGWLIWNSISSSVGLGKLRQVALILIFSYNPTRNRIADIKSVLQLNDRIPIIHSIINHTNVTNIWCWWYLKGSLLWHITVIQISINLVNYTGKSRFQNDGTDQTAICWKWLIIGSANQCNKKWIVINHPIRKKDNKKTLAILQQQLNIC